MKEKLIRASGRLTLAVQNENPPYGYVSVEGHAVIREKVTRDDVRFIVTRYLPADEVDAHLDEMSMTGRCWSSCAQTVGTPLITASQTSEVQFFPPI